MDLPREPRPRGIPRGSATYGPGSGSRSASRPSASLPPSGEVFLARLEVPCFALLEASDATCKVLGKFGHEDELERRHGGDQTRASRTYGGLTLIYDFPSGAMAFVTSGREALRPTPEGPVRPDATDPRVRQGYFVGGLQMLAGGSLDVAGLTTDNLDWRAATVDVGGASIQFAETRLPSARLDDARLLVGQSDATTVALVASDGSLSLSLRDLTASDLDAWIQG
jgi:hypothetical protein